MGTGTKREVWVFRAFQVEMVGIFELIPIAIGPPPWCWLVGIIDRESGAYCLINELTVELILPRGNLPVSRDDKSGVLN